jgi:hypothetical protein
MKISMDFKATRNLFATEIASASATRNNLGMVSGFACTDNFLSAEKIGKQAYPQFY